MHDARHSSTLATVATDLEISRSSTPCSRCALIRRLIRGCRTAALRHKWLLALTACWPALSAIDAHAATYHVGPGHDHATPSEVPWESLNAGDTVRIHWRNAPYLDKWVICRQGTLAQPIIVQGVPGPAGELPVIDGNGATTRRALNYWSGPRGVIKIGGANVPSDTTPAHVVLENLEIRSARPPYSFVDHNGNTQNYPNNAAAVYVEKGDFIVIRNCVMRDCGNGLFVAAAARDVLVEGNHIYDNGNVDSIYEHNSYTAAAGITFQFNRYGPLRAGCLGNNLKDRSAGTVIRYNWIESGNRQLDLVDAEDSATLRADPRYRTTFVYGNVLIEPDGAGNSQIVHYGGDSGNVPTYRKGTLYFYHNTVISTRSGNTTLFRLSTQDESADCRNNILFVSAAGSRLALLAETGILAVTHNWSKPGRVQSHAGSGFVGSIADAATWVTGVDPGFIDVGRENFRLGSQSPCIRAGTGLHPNVGIEHPLLQQYRKHQSATPRASNSLPDLGAFEFSAYAVWQALQFGSEADNERVSGPEADPDGDNMVNLVEYAFDLDPHQASRNGLPRAVRMQVDGETYLGLEFRRRAIPSGLVYDTATSHGWNDWQPGCAYSDEEAVLATETTVDASDNEWTRVRLRESVVTAPQKQLKITVRNNQP